MDATTRSPWRRSLFLSLAALVAGCLALSGCFQSSGSNKSGRGSLTAGVSLPIDSLDPQRVDNGLYVGSSGLFEGLVSQNDDGTGVIPAIARSWTTSKDGLVYTFNLRSNAEYSDGTAITAPDLEWTYKRLLTPGTASGGTVGANSYQSSLGIKNASEYLAGAVTDWSQVGIKALDDAHLQITLEHPNPDFLLGMTYPSMVALDPTTIQQHPKDWTDPKNWVGSGPYVPVSYKPNTSLVVKPQDHYWDPDAIHLDQVTFKVYSDPSAALLAYKNGEVDVIPAAMSDYAGDQELKDQTARVEDYAVEYLQSMFSTNPASQNADVRRALSMAIDRNALAKISIGAQPGTSLVPGSVPGRDQSLGQQYDPEGAAQLLAKAGYPGGKGMPTVLLYGSSTNPELDAIAQMWHQDLGIKVTERIVDVGVYVAKRWETLADPNEIGFYFGSFAGLPTLNNWISNIWGPSFEEEFSMPAQQAQKYIALGSNTTMKASAKLAAQNELLDKYADSGAKEFAATVQKALATTDATEQQRLFNTAAAQREKLALTLPLLWQPKTYLVKPNVQNLHLRGSVESFYLKGISVN